MAKRRMFNTEFIFSDKFTNLPPNAVKLYLNLMGSADDDGFVSGPKRITRGCNCSTEDLERLVMEGFIYIFDSGIAVIRHWFIHNHIRKDRRTDTIFQAEKGKLQLVNNVYEWENVDEAMESETAFNTVSQEDLPDDGLTSCIEASGDGDVLLMTAGEEKPVEEIKTIRYTGKDHDAEEISLPCYFNDSAIQKLFEDFIHQRREMGYRDSMAMIQLFVLQLRDLTREQQMATLLDTLWYRRDEFCIENVTEVEAFRNTASKSVID